MLFLLALIAGHHAAAQDRIFRLAILSPNPTAMEAIREIVLVQLARLGFAEGKNLKLDARFGEVEALPGLAQELASLEPDALFASSNASVDAALAATSSIPIVMFGQDPVGSGYAASLARPGGRVTGVAILTADLDVKRLELLRDVVPAARRAAVLLHSTGRGNDVREKSMGDLASRAGLTISFHSVARVQDYPAAFAAMRAAGAELLVVSANTHFARDVRTLAELARQAGLSTVCEWQEMAAAGCLLGYGPSRTELYRLSANYIARIFRGAAPGDLPIEQPANFELGVNMQVARALGVTIPTTLLLRADEVTE
ncbi:MAG TPA: ABC transporter substrate-binding protein [Alphaproteobacteria bacterium]|nr:ABC transporter substrate-binding protein [Alphaproteobacteria bacterium]